MFDLITGHQGLPHITAEQVSTLNDIFMYGYGADTIVRLQDGTIGQDGRAIVVAAGYWRANGYDMQITEDETIALDPTEAGESRIDVIYAEILQDIPTGNQRTEFVVIQGVPDVTPSEPPVPTGPQLTTDELILALPVAKCTISENTLTYVDQTIEMQNLAAPTEFIGTLAEWTAYPNKSEFDGKQVTLTDQTISIYIYDASTDTLTPVAGNPEGADEQISDISNYLGAKNLYPGTPTNTVDSGLTFTKSSDNVITVTGTATADVTYNLPDIFHKLPAMDQSYVFSMKPDNAPNGVRCYLKVGYQTPYYDIVEDTGGGQEFTLSREQFNLGPYIFIPSGTYMGANGTKFSTMICFKSMFDGVYVPYVRTNATLSTSVDSLWTNYYALDDRSIKYRHGVTNAGGESRSQVMQKMWQYLSGLTIDQITKAALYVRHSGGYRMVYKLTQVSPNDNDWVFCMVYMLPTQSKLCWEALHFRSSNCRDVYNVGSFEGVDVSGNKDMTNIDLYY